MRTAFPIPSLSKRQRNVFGLIATGRDLGHHPATLKKLLDVGAIVCVGDEEIARDRFGAVTVPRYEVPTPLHIRWCQWCSEQITRAGDES